MAKEKNMNYVLVAINIDNNMKKIKVTKQEAWSLGNLYRRILSIEKVPPEYKETFLKIKKKYAK